MIKNQRCENCDEEIHCKEYQKYKNKSNKRK